MEALLELLSRRLRPTVLVFEDMQWADDATLDITGFLGRRIGDTNGLFILTYRDGEIDTDHPLRVVIGNLPPQLLDRIHLVRLSTEGVTDMVRGTNRDVDEVVALTGGNPLFVTEVLACGADQVPASVRDSVLGRAAKVSPGARRLLDLVSVIPGGANRALVETILEPSWEEATECERRGLLRINHDTVTFRHELVRRAVESALSPDDRRRLNQGVLDLIVDRGDPAVLVHHAREAGDEAGIVEFAPRAARAAMTAGSYTEALGHFRTLDPYLHRIAEIDQASVLEDRARIELNVDEKAALDTLVRVIDLYRSAGADRPLARALTLAVRPYEVCGRPREAEACSAEAVAMLEKFGASADLAFALGQKAWLAGMHDRGQWEVALIDQAISLAEAVGDEQTIIHSLNSKGCWMLAGGDRAGFEALEECRQRAKEQGFPFEEIRALANMANYAVETLELDWANDLALRSREIAARHEFRHAAAYAQIQIAGILIMRGDWAAAEEAISDVLWSSPRVELIATSMLGQLQARSGRPEAPTTIERCWRLAQTSDELQYLAHAASIVAEYLWLMGEDGRDRIGTLDEVLEASTRARLLAETGALAFWLWKLGHLHTTPDRMAEPYRLIIVGEHAEAATIWEEKGMPYERALALMHGGEAEQLQALRILEDLGASATAGKVRKSLLDMGVRVPRGRAATTRDHPAQLTGRQAEVLELLAGGLSNLEIADRLFISRHTAENHVAAILMKLDATDRHAAVDAARTLGFVA
jgi:DNA-binding CsgD family transcriptional regulator